MRSPCRTACSQFSPPHVKVFDVETRREDVDVGLLGSNTICGLVGILPAFQRNIVPSSSVPFLVLHRVLVLIGAGLAQAV
jgi:hypothetical protein